MSSGERQNAISEPDAGGDAAAALRGPGGVVLGVAVLGGALAWWWRRSRAEGAASKGARRRGAVRAGQALI